MSEDQIQEVKDRVDLVELVKQYVPLKASGVNHKGACPFHKEKTPSFMVNSERQIYKCFGCNEAGDAISFVQKIEGLNFPEALQLLADRVGIKLKRQKSNVQYQQEKDQKTTLYRINAASAKFFNYILQNHPSAQLARTYLIERGIKPESIEKFQVGFAPAGGVLRNWLVKQGVKPADLKLVGQPDRFRNRIIFPLRDPLGNVVGFTGRILPGDKSGPKYFNTPETPVFKKSQLLYGLYEGRQQIRRDNLAVMVEGQMDVIMSHQIGIGVAVASSGTALTENHWRVLRRYASRVILALDADQAGIAATKKSLKMLINQDLAVKVTQFKGKKDAGELIAEQPDQWPIALKEAQSGIDWLIAVNLDSLTRPLSAQAKRAVAAEVLPFIKLFSDPVEQAHYLAQLAKTLGVNEQSLRAALSRTISHKASDRPPEIKKNEQLTLEERLLSVVLINPELISKFDVTAELFESDPWLSWLFNQVENCYSSGKWQSTADFLSKNKESISREDQLKITSILMEIDRIQGLDSSLEAVGLEFATRIKRKRRESTKIDIAERIAKAEAAGDRGQVKDLMNELQNFLGLKK
ncbi:DNA primase [Candidatus Berkelbacteria bacterium]|nr:DNA primase [Candidatus Berkelbacteria bacterium]